MANILLIRTAVSLNANKHFNHVTPPLGLMYIASALRKDKENNVEILDMRLSNSAFEEIKKKLLSFKPEFVGISSFSQEADVLYSVTKIIKDLSKSCFTIAGGPHVNACPDVILNDPNLDYVVFNEGEETFPELIQALLFDKNSVSKVKGIAYRKDNKIHKTQTRQFINNLDDLTFPAWDLIEQKKYFIPGNRFLPFYSRNPYMPIITSRGCPFGCIYCHNILGKLFRVRSPQNVFTEIKVIYERYGIREFEIIDDCFNFNRDRALEICDLIIEADMDIKLFFPNGLRGDLLDEQLLKKLHRAGTVLIAFAPETGSERLQKVIKKNMNLSKLNKMINLAVKLEIHAHGYFMMGFPTETKKDIDETIKFAVNSRLHTISFFILNPFPNTPVYLQGEKTGTIKALNFVGVDYINAKFNLSDVPVKQLRALRRKGYYKFYFSLKRLALIFFTKSLVGIRHLIHYFILFLTSIKE